MRFDLSDREWEIIQPLLPPTRQGGERADDRRVLNGIFYVLRAGIPWNDVPSRYGPPTTIYNRFRRWAQQGIWQRIFDELQARHPSTLQMIDTTVVPAHRAAAGAEKGILQRRARRGGGDRPLPRRADHEVPRRLRRTQPAAAVLPDRRPAQRHGRRLGTGGRKPPGGRDAGRGQRLRQQRVARLAGRPGADAGDPATRIGRVLGNGNWTPHCGGHAAIADGVSAMA